MSEALEFLDLVSPNDQVISRMERSEVYSRGLHNFRLVYALIENSDSRLWIPRRTNKQICPFHLDASMGGHVVSGESYERAFARELDEELGLDADSESIAYLGKLSPYQDNSYAFAKVYKLYRDEAPVFNPDDFSGAEWLSPEEIIDRGSSGDQVKSDLVIVARALIRGRL